MQFGVPERCWPVGTLPSCVKRPNRPCMKSFQCFHPNSTKEVCMKSSPLKSFTLWVLSYILDHSCVCSFEVLVDSFLRPGLLQEHRKERRRLQANRADILAMGFQNINEENQERPLSGASLMWCGCHVAGGLRPFCFGSADGGCTWLAKSVTRLMNKRRGSDSTRLNLIYLPWLDQISLKVGSKTLICAQWI